MLANKNEATFDITVLFLYRFAGLLLAVGTGSQTLLPQPCGTAHGFEGVHDNKHQEIESVHG